ncbi:hypothetical protein BLD48_05785 [Exiguobacterium sp. KRL4]|uniref:hypothetical protein n=1 Tax=Exiguobacterium sp. KRL4 TaxID=1914536 RepID=UPI0008F8CA89|nr:hypothetical protein [Exiguobacterium sp. KRL4]OIN67401.1 hypothetical protein BLD48_05785 [Exiguobacterium sp. KRL4]
MEPTQTTPPDTALETPQGTDPTAPNPQGSDTPEPLAPEKTFTQAELEDVLKQRLAREASKYKDYDEKAKRLEELEKAAEKQRLDNLSEADRLKELAETKDNEAKELADKLAKLEQSYESERKQSAFKQVASSGDFNLSADRVEAALKLADLSAVEKAEDGGYDVKGVIQSLVETYPFLIEKAEAQPIGKPVPGSIDLPKSTEEQLEVLRVKAKKSGNPNDLAKYATAKRDLGL